MEELEKQDFGHWECNKDIPEDAIGFVYKITDINLKKYYIGIKLLYSTRTLPPLKGQKRKRKVTKDSDWRKYCSSSGKISEKIKANKELFKFQILSFHPSKSLLKLEEARMVIENINDPDCYNEMVNLRIRIPKDHS